MLEEDAEIYRNSLIDLLDKRDLQWIVGQVSDEIAKGKIVEKSIDTRIPVVDAVTQKKVRQPKGPLTKFTSTIPYTESEKLLILIEAVEMALIMTYRMQEGIPANLASNLPVIFIPDESNSEIAHQIKTTTDTEREEGIGELNRALLKIKGKM